MNLKYYDLNVGWDPVFEDKLDLFSSLGWQGVCFTEKFSSVSKFGRFAKKILEIKEKSPIDIYVGAIVSKPIKKNARKALEMADIILAKNENREASECWEVDILCGPESVAKKDFMNQRNSGIDHIMARFMADRCIAIEINFSEVLYSNGKQRSIILGRISQNIRIARKYNTPLIITSGSNGIYDIRKSLDLISFGITLGMTHKEAKNSISENPIRIIQKSMDRKNPNIILKGLEVLDWGEIKKPEKKRMYGWY